MSIITPPGYDRPDYSGLIPLFGPLFINNGGIHLNAHQSTQYGPFDVSLYNWTSGGIVTGGINMGVELDWYDDANQDTHIGSFEFTALASAPVTCTIHTENLGPWVTVTAQAGAVAITNGGFSLQGTNADAVSPFVTHGNPLMLSSSSGALTATFSSNSFYGGPAQLSYNCTNGAIAEVQLLSNYQWQTIWSNAPGTTDSRWSSNFIDLPAGLHQVILTSTMSSTFNCTLSARNLGR